MTAEVLEGAKDDEVTAVLEQAAPEKKAEIIAEAKDETVEAILDDQTP